jgi:L-fucose mutarotase
VLKHIDPLLNAELLYVLKSMGHGDDLIISDTNFPADSVARQTTYGKLLRVDADAPRVTRAILSLFPLDTFVPLGEAAARMEVVGKPHEVLDVQKEVQAEIDRAEGKSWPMGSIERFAFYEKAKKSYCVVQSHERRFYGCFLFKKGVIAPDVKLGA